MSGGPYKLVRVRDRFPGSPVLTPFRARRPIRWVPWSQILEGQDDVVGSFRRVVAAQPMFAGTDQDHVPITSLTAGQMNDLDYAVGTADVRLMPGCFLDVMVLAVPSGAVANGGNRGSVKVTATFTKGANSTSTTVEIPLVPSTEDDGDPGEYISTLRTSQAFQLQPAGSIDNPETMADYSEWVDCELALVFNGGARPIDFCVVERGWYHAQAASPTERQSAHAYIVSGSVPQVQQTPGPQEARADGGSSEGRFGTHQLLDVVQRQSDRIGPRIVYWSSWDPDTFDEDNVSHQPLQITGVTGLANIFNQFATAWSADGPGWFVDGAGAQLWRYHDGNLRLGLGRAVIPVRVVLRAAIDHASRTATVRLQSSETEWVEIVVSGTSNTRYEAHGFLECQVVGDQAGAGNLQCLAELENSADTLELYNISIDFGEWS